MKLSNHQLDLFCAIEKELQAFFRLFENLCEQCFIASKSALESGNKNSDCPLCCCMVDNQVHDYWSMLNQVQRTKRGPRWSDELPKIKVKIGRRRIPGNGPCSALSEKGCTLRNLRPPTCSTQLCLNMIAILIQLALVERPHSVPCQIEDLLKLPSPLNALYGIEKQVCNNEQIEAFRKELQELRKKFNDIDPKKRRDILCRQIEFIQRSLQN